MSEDLLSIAITFAILLIMFIFVPCLEVTARGCKKIGRSFSPARNREDWPAASFLRSASKSPLNHDNS